MSSIPHAPLGTEFEKFLYEPIGQDNNGMPLSVLSALARQDVDPWNEAAKLAQLPEQQAVAQLVSLLGAFPRAPLVCPDPASIAPRLVTLLPRRRDRAYPQVKRFEDPLIHAAVVSDLSRVLLSFVVTCAFLIFFSIWLVAGSQAPEQTQAPSTPAHNASSQSPPASDKSR
jgi:hypothetical protein